MPRRELAPRGQLLGLLEGGGNVIFTNNRVVRHAQTETVQWPAAKNEEREGGHFECSRRRRRTPVGGPCQILSLSLSLSLIVTTREKEEWGGRARPRR